VREILAVSKRASQKIDTNRFNVKKLNERDEKEQHQATTKKVSSSGKLNGKVGHQQGQWYVIRENIKISAQGSLGYFESKHRKPWLDEECSKLVDRRKQAEQQWLKDPSEANEDNISDVRPEASRHFRNKKRVYLKERINKLESNS
jgi:predicted chitinase